ncbi:MAG: hypothetical protein ACK2UO_10415 [Caldilineaceae bacterium]
MRTLYFGAMDEAQAFRAVSNTMYAPMGVGITDALIFRRIHGLMGTSADGYIGVDY